MHLVVGCSKASRTDSKESEASAKRDMRARGGARKNAHSSPCARLAFVSLSPLRLKYAKKYTCSAGYSKAG